MFIETMRCIFRNMMISSNKIISYKNREIFRELFCVIKDFPDNQSLLPSLIFILESRYDVWYYMEIKEVRQNVNVLYYLAKYNCINSTILLIQKYGNEIDIEKEEKI